MSKQLLVAVIIAVSAEAAFGQGIPKEYLEMQAAMAKFQAASIKPGDEALPCEALHKELVTLMNAPAVQAYAARNDAAAARQLAAIEKSKGAMSPEAAVALAGMLAPAAAMGMTPNAAQSQQLAMEQMKQLTAMMPVMMRSQRVMMLAAVKNCAWATGGLGAYPGAVPGAVPGAALPR